MPRSLLLLLITLIVAAACAAPTADRVVQESSDGRFEQVAVDDVQIWRSAAGSRDGDAALVTGTLGLDADCGVLLYDEESDLRYPVVWPAGTDIEQADPLAIRLPDGAIVGDGQIVSGGGGYHSDLTLFPDGCADSGETAVFNASGDVEVAEAREGPESAETEGSSAAPSSTPIPPDTSGQVPDADPFGEGPVPPMVGTLPLANAKEQWAAGDLVHIDYGQVEDDLRSPEYFVQPIIDGQVGDPVFREYYGNGDRPPSWHEVHPQDLPLDVLGRGIGGPTIDILILPPTISTGTYVICNPGRPARCTPPLSVVTE